MIPLAEINNLALNYRVAAETIEKDYVISWILHLIAVSELKDHFLFYGGTAIKRMFFEEHRFSEDIDFLSVNRFSSDYILSQLGVLNEAKQKTNLILEIRTQNILASKDRLQVYVDYISYDEIVGAPKEIRLDFIMNMDFYGKTQKKKMINSYSDLSSSKTVLNVMTLNTILANKLGMLYELTRNEPRDVYDIWFLLNRQNRFDFCFKEVCQLFKKKYGFNFVLTTFLMHLKKGSIEKNWEGRLANQMSDLPACKVIIADIEEKLQQLYAAYVNLNPDGYKK